jgi:protein gp37
MAEHSHISWTDHSFAPWFGCTKVSVGPKGACENCYAEHLTVTRFGKAWWGPHAERVRSAASTWKRPLAWDRKAARDGTRPFVFCSHLSDVFDNQVDPAWRLDLFTLIAETPHLTWLLLTKRPQNIARLFSEACLETRADDSPASDWWPRNAAIGCTIVTQSEANRDVPHLLDAGIVNPAFTFLSMEPLLGPVDLTRIPGYAACPNYDALAGLGREDPDYSNDWWGCRGPRIDWVITGGETDQGGRNARPSNPDWFRSLRDQCQSAGRAYQHKQNGEFLDIDHIGDAWNTLPNRVRSDQQFVAGKAMVRVGKKAAGRLLDGREWNGRPALLEPANAEEGATINEDSGVDETRGGEDE